MKKVCFIEMEGVLFRYGAYSPDKARVDSFLSSLFTYAKSNQIELFLLSGHHDLHAAKVFEENEFKKYFDRAHFLCADESYIKSKAEMDRALHEEKLSKDPSFLDTYFKQVAIKKVLEEKNLFPSEALLLSDDIWVDGYYTTRFSKVDFAIFEENVLDRGNKTQRISGLAYFSLDFDSVKLLLENFPRLNTSALDKYVFETMKKALIDPKMESAVRKSAAQRMGN